MAGKNDLIFIPRVLELSDLPFLQSMGEVKNGYFNLERSAKGYKLKTPITVPLSKILALGQRGLAKYIITALASQRPKLIPFE